jgi:uncharacterized membrane protein HdeD (DUF308 family)
MTINTDSADAGQGLKRESKFGLLVGFAVTAATDAALQGLTNLDTSHWSGWWVTLAVAAVGTAIGLLTAYKTKNRKR